MMTGFRQEREPFLSSVFANDAERLPELLADDII